MKVKPAWFNHTCNPVTETASKKEEDWRRADRKLIYFLEIYRYLLKKKKVKLTQKLVSSEVMTLQEKRTFYSQNQASVQYSMK